MSIYRQIRTSKHPKASTAGNVYEHILIAEAALGHHLPARAEIHHVDEDPTNNSRMNLVICEDRKYHRLLHTRTRVVKAGGNADADKICSGCHRIFPKASFYKNRSTADGLHPHCKPCHEVACRRQRGKS